MNEINLGSDSVYKRLYSFPEMVADLLRSVLPASTVEALDLDSLEKVPAAYVGDDFHQRHGDTVWRVRAAGAEGGWAYVLVLLEFQSSSDATMALRVNEYTVMLYRELLRAKAGALNRGVRGASPSHGKAFGDLPPVLPVVLYNGESRWAAARDVYDLLILLSGTELRQIRGRRSVPGVLPIRRLNLALHTGGEAPDGFLWSQTSTSTVPDAVKGVRRPSLTTPAPVLAPPPSDPSRR